MKTQFAIALAALLSVSAAVHASGWGVEDMNEAYGGGVPSAVIPATGPAGSPADSVTPEASLRWMDEGYGGRRATAPRRPLSPGDEDVSQWGLNELYSAFGG